MPTSSTRLLDEDPVSPFFPPPSTSRPGAEPIADMPGSDSSVDTLSSTSTSHTSCSDSSANGQPYSRLVVVEPSSLLSSPRVADGAWDLGMALAETGGSRSMPGPSEASVDPLDEAPSSFIPPTSNNGTATTSRHQSLPSLITSPETSLLNSTTSLLGSSTRISVPPTTYTHTPDHSPALASAPSFSSSSSVAPYPPVFASSSRTFPPPPPGAITAFPSTSMSRSQSHTSHASLTRLPSPTAARPSSSGTLSSGSTGTSTRPWVRDSDASSVCSGGSGGCWSAQGGTEGSLNGEEEDGSGEVLKLAGGVDEFLDPRPEPSGAKLSIDRSEPTVVVLLVTLPGFSLDNITVAMRRGHKVHVVADAYGENGGHFEKLISLGSGVSSAAPRAEFDGTTLKVYVQRRAPRKTSVPSLAAGSEEVTSPPISPPFTASSPSSSSISSLSLPTSPSVPGLSAFVDAENEPPIVTRSTAEQSQNLHQKKSSKSLTGPEGAKAAARVAREEAASRAREEAKALPKLGRRVVLSRDGGGARAFSTSSASSSSSQDEAWASEPLAVPPERNGTIKARSPSPRPAAPRDSASPSESTSTHSSSDGSIASSTFSTTSTASTSASSTHSLSSPAGDETTSTSPSRPKFRASNLTLRPGDRTSFVEAAAKAEAGSRDQPSPGGSSTGGGGGGGSATPKVERGAEYMGVLDFGFGDGDAQGWGGGGALRAPGGGGGGGGWTFRRNCT